MKTNLISKAVVMLAVVMASVMNFSASASNPTQYVKNEEMTGELMTAKTIFKNEDGHLFRHLRYTYTYDTENRGPVKKPPNGTAHKRLGFLISRWMFLIPIVKLNLAMPVGTPRAMLTTAIFKRAFTN